MCVQDRLMAEQTDRSGITFVITGAVPPKIPKRGNRVSIIVAIRQIVAFTDIPGAVDSAVTVLSDGIAVCTVNAQQPSVVLTDREIGSLITGELSCLTATMSTTAFTADLTEVWSTVGVKDIARQTKEL